MSVSADDAGKMSTHYLGAVNCQILDFGTALDVCEKSCCIAVVIGDLNAIKVTDGLSVTVERTCETVCAVA